MVAIVWAFTGRAFYRMHVVERGWSSDEYEKWLAELLIQVLLSKSPPSLEDLQITAISTPIDLGNSQFG